MGSECDSWNLCALADGPTCQQPAAITAKRHTCTADADSDSQIWAPPFAGTDVQTNDCQIQICRFVGTDVSPAKRHVRIRPSAAAAAVSATSSRTTRPPLHPIPCLSPRAPPCILKPARPLQREPAEPPPRRLSSRRGPWFHRRCSLQREGAPHQSARNEHRD